MTRETGRVKKDSGLRLFSGKTGKAINIFICLHLAALLWILVALERIETKSLTFPISLLSDFPAPVPLGNFPDTVSVTVESSGFSFFKLARKLSKQPEKGMYRQQFNGIEANGIWSVKKAVSSYFSWMGFKGKIIKVEPENIVLSKNPSNFKKIPVLLTTRINLEKGFMIFPIPEVSPRVLEVFGNTGSSEYPDTIRLHFEPDGKFADTLIYQMIPSLPPGLYAARQKIQILVPICPYTEKKIKVKIQPQNAPMGFRYQLSPSVIELSCKLPLEDFDRYGNPQVFADLVQCSTAVTTVGLSCSSDKNWYLSENETVYFPLP